MLKYNITKNENIFQMQALLIWHLLFYSVLNLSVEHQRKKYYLTNIEILTYNDKIFCNELGCLI